MAARQAVRKDETQLQLEEKTLQLLSVQRNYDTMSRMMQAKQREQDELQTKYEDEQARCISLTVQLDDMRKRAEGAEAQVTKLRGLPDQVAALQAELQKLRFEASLEKGKASTLEDRLAGLSKSAEESEFGNSQLRRDLDQTRAREVQLQAQVKRMQQEVDGLKTEIRAMSSEAKALKDTLTLAKNTARQAEQRASLLSGRLVTKDEAIAGLSMNIRALQSAVDEAKAAHQVDLVSLAAAKSHGGVLEGQLASTRQSLKLAEEVRTGAERALSRTQEDLAESQAALTASADRCQQLVALLAAAEEKCESVMGQKVEVGALVTAFQVQLKQSKALLAEANEKLSAKENELRGAAAAARLAEDAAAARYRALHARMEQQQRSHAKLCGVLVQRVEGALEKLASLAASTGQASQDLQERQERLLNGFSSRIQVWEQSACEQEELLALLSTHIGALLASTDARAARERQQRSKQDLVSQLEMQQQRRAEHDVGLLQQKVQELESALGNERRALATQRQVNARQEQEHEAAIRAAQLLTEQRAEAERVKLATRLDKLSAEVSRLEAAAADAGRAAAETLRMEREQMARQVGVLRAQAEAERKRADEAEREKHAAIGGQLASLSRMHQSELETLRAESGARIAGLEGSLATCRANIEASWDAAQRLLQDMATVAEHLVKMGWEVTEAPDAAVVIKGGGEDGSGNALSKAALLLRLQFSYITEAVQNMSVKAAAAAAAPAAPVASVDLMRELRATVARLLHAEEALAPPCTCLSCLSILKQPVTCIPCGHTLCGACYKKEGGCVECGVKAQAALPNAPLEAICSKYEYRVSTLRSIQMLMQSAGIEDVAKSGASRPASRR